MKFKTMRIVSYTSSNSNNIKFTLSMKNKDNIILCGYRLILIIILDSKNIIYSQVSYFYRLKNILSTILNS